MLHDEETTETIKIKPIEIENIETLLEVLEEEQARPCYNSFLDVDEPQMLDDFTYRQMQFRKYGYAVSNLNKAKDDSL